MSSRFEIRLDRERLALLACALELAGDLAAGDAQLWPVGSMQRRESERIASAFRRFQCSLPRIRGDA